MLPSYYLGPMDVQCREEHLGDYRKNEESDLQNELDDFSGGPFKCRFGLSILIFRPPIGFFITKSVFWLYASVAPSNKTQPVLNPKT